MASATSPDALLGGGGGITGAQGGLFVSAFGLILSAIGGVYGAYLNKGVQEHNAKIAEAQAKLVEANIGVRNYVSQKQIAQMTGTQRASYAKAGVKPMTGSPIDVVVDTQSNMELETALSNINDRMTAAGYQSEADLRRAAGYAGVALASAKAAKSLLSTGTDIYLKTKLDTGKKTIGEG